MENKPLFGKCPYVTSQKVLAGKWSIYILYLLKDGPVRFNRLQRRIVHGVRSKREMQQLVSRLAENELDKA